MATATAPELILVDKDDTEIRRITFPAENIREVKVMIDGVERDAIEAVINTSDVDRYETIVEPMGADLENFRKNPILLWAHGNDFAIGSWPVGTVPKLKVTKKEIIALVVFDTDGDLGAELDRLYRAKILRGFSIGFLPRSFLQEQPEKDGPTIIRFVDWELVELSAVAVPANPNALAKSLASGELSFRTADLGRVIHLNLAREQVVAPTADELKLLQAKSGGDSVRAKTPDTKTPGTETKDRGVAREHGKNVIYSTDYQMAEAALTGEADKVAEVAEQLADGDDPLPVPLGETDSGDSADVALTAGLAQLDKMIEQTTTRGGPSVPGVPGVPGSASTPDQSVQATLEGARAALTGGGEGDFPDGDLAAQFRELQMKYQEAAAAEIGKPADVDLEELSPEARGEIAAMQFILEHLEKAGTSEPAAKQEESLDATSLGDEVAELRKLVLLQAARIVEVEDGLNDVANDRSHNETHERERSPRKYLTKAGREALNASADGLEKTAKFLRDAAKTMEEQSGVIRDAIEIIKESAGSTDETGDGGDQDDRDGGPKKTEQMADAAPEFIRELVAAEVDGFFN